MQIPSDDYQWAERQFLAEGGFGKVFKVRRISIDQHVAVKVMYRSSFPTPESLQLLIDQINIQTELAHPHITGLYDVLTDAEHCYIVMQLCEGSLRDEIESNGVLGVVHACEIFKQLMQGVHYMTQKEYIHRDVKPENVLVKEGIYKISDFGFATKADITGKQVMTMCCGTPLYMAPEILQERPYTSKCDIWSWGMVLYQSLFGITPWPCKDLDTYLFSMKQTNRVRFPYSARIGSTVRDFLRKCLTVDQDSRMGWKQFYNHPFLQGQFGDEVQTRKFSEQFNRAMGQLINLNELFEEFYNKTGKKQLDMDAFRYLVEKIDPKISSIEAHYLFQGLDQDGSEKICYEEIIQILQNYNFQSAMKKGEQVIFQMRQLIKAQNLDLNIVFNNIDMNGSNQLTYIEFEKFILQVAPGLRAGERKAVFQLLDGNKNGSIQRLQFIQQLGGFTSQSFNETRYARKVLRVLRQACIYHNISVDHLLASYDREGDGLNQIEFFTLITRIDPYARLQDVKPVFLYVSQGHDNITVDELYKALVSAA